MNQVPFLLDMEKNDIYENPRTHEFTSIPRHVEINEYTAKGIIKKLSK